MLAGLRYLSRRAFRRHWSGPRDLRRYESETGPHLYKSPFGVTFELEPDQTIDRAIVFHGLYEDRILEFIGSLLDPESVVLDVGANIGNHALFLARRCSAVHCFEPNPRALERLKKNIALNHATNIAVHEFGLGDKNETARFYDNISGNLGASGFAKADGKSRVLELPLRSADEAISELGLHRVDLIKMDVEGMEERVLSALHQTLHAHHPLLSFEFHGDTKSQLDFERIRELLSGYRIFEPRFSPENAGLFTRSMWNVRTCGVPELVPIDHPERRLYENLLAFPQ